MLCVPGSKFSVSFTGQKRNRAQKDKVQHQDKQRIKGEVQIPMAYSDSPAGRCSQGERLWYIYTMEYYSAIKKNTFESVLMRWMKREPIIQSEVSQKEKHQYTTLTHIYMEFRKMVRDSKRDTDVQSRLLDSEGEGEGGMIWENGTETCILSCKKRIASLCSMQDTGCLGLVHGDDPKR